MIDAGLADRPLELYLSNVLTDRLAIGLGQCLQPIAYWLVTAPRLVEDGNEPWVIGHIDIVPDKVQRSTASQSCPTVRMRFTPHVI
jgi:hypothetical protein